MIAASALTIGTQAGVFSLIFKSRSGSTCETSQGTSAVAGCGRLGSSPLSRPGTVYFLIVSKGENIESLRSTVTCISKAVIQCSEAFQQALLHPSVTVLLDETPEANLLTFSDAQPEICMVPGTFRCRYGGRAKARALQYFIGTKNHKSSDWIMHLDEETQMGPDAVMETIAFISASTISGFSMGQGLILYNNCNNNAAKYFGNVLIAVADVARVVDDLGKLFWQNAVRHTPSSGMRGSFLLVQADVERFIGWDTACLVEDYWFSRKVSS
jgi:hypothetical protein